MSQFRTENIAKGSFRFAEWEYIEEQVELLLKRLKEENYLPISSTNSFAYGVMFSLSIRSKN